MSGFIEKPEPATARTLVESGRYLWNSGMFLFTAGAYLEALAHHAPDIAAAAEGSVAEAYANEDFTRLGAAFASSPSNSIDYAVMEKTDRGVVVPLDAGWSDVGSWRALQQLGDIDPRGNCTRGEVWLEDSDGCYVLSTGRLVVALGLERCLVVETPDAVLVSPLHRAQDVKQLVDCLTAEGRGEVLSNLADPQEKS